MTEISGKEEHGVELTFGSVSKDAFDQAGVLYAIGTDFGRQAYENPADSGKVAMFWSNDAANFYSTQGGHKVGDKRQASSVICANRHPGFNATMWSKGEPGAWFAVDLKSVSVMPTHFAYRNDYGGGGNHPRTFELQGSSDGAQWTTLRTFTDEGWSGPGAKDWPVVGCTQYFSIFRILNKGAPNHLCCSGIEIYGRVKHRGAESSPTAVAA